MLISLRDRWCLVLGASSGMGRATALALAEQGMHVIGVHFDTAERADSVPPLLDEIREHGVSAHFVNANAASARVRAELVPVIAGLTGGAGVHVLLHSLAFGTLQPYLPRDGNRPLTARQLDMTVDVMAHSLVYWVQDLVEAGLLPSGAKVLAMTSAGSSRAMPSYGAVSAAKCALESHVRQLACELARFGISVNALRAGVTPTPALRRIPEYREFVAQAAGVNPHGRLTLPEDVAEAVVLLAGSDSSWITGNVIGVDGAEHLSGVPSWNPARTTVNGKGESDAHRTAEPG
ncbi:SDR family oxidoreductase [Amycolatopsis sp. YIM 10]|uniref:SDR family oxidoreductase n=1 Tax=Amycolatopsis sp. YIM 10 TaxID=2653857 RepID=UPI0012905F62|nr:SDR family oxidoreductase [Amycolatopsis sp. YIM 10]QFU90545.1 Enoyl-[acyl-carrier-protein] reductase [NADPH] FabL [Amycolatopsis sp. YIM 10]